MTAILVHRRGPLEGQKDKFDEDVIRIGRQDDNHVVLAEKVVSSYHAEIRRRGEGYTLVDLESTNGTFVNGERVQKVLLNDHDKVEIGENGPVFEFRSDGADESRGPRIVPLSGAWDSGKSPLQLERGSLTLGRGPDNDIVVGRSDGSVVSTEHAELRIHSDYCELEDLGSTNGTFVNGEKIRAVRLQDGDRVELGEGGPAFEFKWKGRSRRSGGGRSRESDKILRKLEHAARGGPAGDRTMMFLQAAQKYYKRRRWPLVLASSVVFVVAVYFGYSWYREMQKVKEMTTLADSLFYQMRAQEAENVRLRSSLSKTDREGRSAQKLKMENEYEQYLEKIGVYRGKSETEKLIMRMTRLLGESELEVPRDFSQTVMSYVERWRSTRRLRDALDRAKKDNLIQLIKFAIEEEGLPKEFLFLALQESNFDPTRVGPQTRFGIAKGMWQFIPPTATQYGLVVGPLKGEPKFDLSDQRHNA